MRYYSFHFGYFSDSGMTLRAPVVVEAETYPDAYITAHKVIEVDDEPWIRTGFYRLPFDPRGKLTYRELMQMTARLHLVVRQEETAYMLSEAEEQPDPEDLAKHMPFIDKVVA